MGIRISGSQLQSSLISLHRLMDAPGFVEDVSQIEIRERIPRVGFNGKPVMLFGMSEILPIVIERSQVDMRRGMHRFEVKHLVICGDCLTLSIWIFFQRDSARKPRRNLMLARTRFRSRDWRAGHDFFAL